MRVTRGQKEHRQQHAAPKRKRSGEHRFKLFSRLTGWVSRLLTFLREVRVEMSRVVWPGKEETYTYTLVVVVAVVVVAAWVGLWDTLFTQLIAALKLYD
jgi:preprotein translocase subunit SecE